MSEKLYEYVKGHFDPKRITGEKKEWIEAKYAAVLDWDSGYDVQPIKNDKEIEELLWDQISHKDDDDSYEVVLINEEGDQFNIKIDSFIFHLEPTY